MHSKRVVAGLAVLMFTLVAGCGGASHEKSGKPAAEPAVAPPLTAKPAGRVVPVGAAPEGVVADGVTHRVAVGVRKPNRLVLLDSRSGRVTKRVPLPGHLRHLQLAASGGPVLVPDENSEKLLTVGLPGGMVKSRVQTGNSPHDATAAANGTVFVANEFGDVVAVRGGKVVHRFTDATQPAGLAAVLNQVALVDVRQDNLHIYDADKLSTITTLPAGDGPTHVVSDARGHLVVTDTRGGAILLYTLDPTPQRIGQLKLPGRPYGIAYDPVRDRVWATLTARNQLVGIDESSAKPQVVARYPTVRQPNTVAVDTSNGHLFVTGTRKGVLQIIKP